MMREIMQDHIFKEQIVLPVRALFPSCSAWRVSGKGQTWSRSPGLPGLCRITAGAAFDLLLLSSSWLPAHLYFKEKLQEEVTSVGPLLFLFTSLPKQTCVNTARSIFDHYSGALFSLSLNWLLEMPFIWNMGEYVIIALHLVLTTLPPRESGHC